jgi:HEAT repeat protein
MSGRKVNLRSGTINDTGNVQGKEDIPNLKNRLKDESPLVRYTAAADLKKPGIDTGAAVSEETLNDLIPKVNDFNAELFGSEAGLRKVLRILRKRLKDPTDKVQFASAEALWRIADYVEEGALREQQIHENQGSKAGLLQ